MNTLNFFRTANRVATLISFSVMFVLFLKAIFKTKVEAYCPAILDFFAIFEPILQSIVASYIFYLFAVHLKDMQDKRLLAPFLIKELTL